MNDQKNNNFIQGLFIGIVVGVVVTLMFTTKKGRQIFNTLTSEGIEELEGLRKRLNEVKSSIPEELLIDEDESVEKPNDDGKKIIASVKETTNGVKKHGIARRLFKGIPRKH